ncbi:protein translocase subunit SecD [soil metagenome]
MLNFAPWKRLLVMGLCLIGLLVAFPNLFYDRVERSNDAYELAERSGQPLGPEAGLWPSWAPSGLLNLGLDLRGGAHLLVEVAREDVYADRLENLWPQVRDTLRAEAEAVGTVRRVEGAADELRVRVGDEAAMAQALQSVRDLAEPVFSLTGLASRDLEVQADGADIVVTLSAAERGALDERTMEQSLEIIRRRVDETGTREPTIQRQGAERILIQVPGIGSAEELMEIIGRTARLSFHPVESRTSDPAASEGLETVVMPSLDEEGIYYVLERRAVVSGDQLVDAQPAFDQNGRPAVNFRFNPQGGAAFGRYTAANVGNPFAIALDGEVISAPVIQSHIPGGTGIITGNFSAEESTRLAILLRSGALPAEIRVLEQRTVGPELGQDSIDAGKIAAIVAMGLVLVFMAGVYGWFGIIANVALLINLALVFGLLTAIGATLTLPGIAGLVLTIGMAVDANVLIFERIREELKTAKGPARAIDLGYEKALSAIIDANVTTLITAVILYALGSGPVRGFAVTLSLGVVCSVFTALFVTRLMIAVWFERRRPKTVTV